MEMPLTPMDFARRARRLYADREAVVDGDLRLTYAQFLERCDRWSSALQALGIQPGDRVAYIAPNTSQLWMAFETGCLVSNTSSRWKVRAMAGSTTNRRYSRIPPVTTKSI